MSATDQATTLRGVAGGGASSRGGMPGTYMMSRTVAIVPLQKAVATWRVGDACQSGPSKVMRIAVALRRMVSRETCAGFRLVSLSRTASRVTPGLRGATGLPSEGGHPTVPGGETRR